MNPLLFLHGKRWEGKQPMKEPFTCVVDRYKRLLSDISEILYIAKGNSFHCFVVWGGRRGETEEGREDEM